MSTTDYQAALRDISFVLFEQLSVQDMNQAHFADFDEGMYRMILDEAKKMAEETIARPHDEEQQNRPKRYTDIAECRLGEIARAFPQERCERQVSRKRRKAAWRR